MTVKWLDEFLRQKKEVFPEWNLNPADEYEILKIFSDFFNAHNRKYPKLIGKKHGKPQYNLHPMESLVTACVCHYLEKTRGFYGYNVANLQGIPRWRYKRGFIFFYKKLHNFYKTKPNLDYTKIINFLKEFNNEEKKKIIKLYETYPTYHVPRKKIASIIKLHFPEKIKTKDLVNMFHLTKFNKSVIYTIMKKMREYQLKFPEKFVGVV